MSELRYPFFNYVSMETKHSFIILNLIPYEIFFEGNAAKIISYQAKKTVCLYLY